MRSAWSPNRPAVGMFQRPGTPEPASLSATALTSKDYASLATYMATKSQAAPQQPVGMWGLLQRVTQPIAQFFQAKWSAGPETQNKNPKITDFSRQWQEQIETYAEHPMEAALFGVTRIPKGYAVSQEWAKAIANDDMQTRDAALNLLKGYLTYTGVGELSDLSPHTQMKFLIFTPHLNEGALGKAMVYESLLGQAPKTIIEFAGVLQHDFSHLPPLAQVMVLKQLVATWKSNQDLMEEADATAFHKMMRALIIQFYSGRQEVFASLLQQAEKVRLGFLKMNPVDQAYQQELEEVEKKYRQKLRLLKKQRSQKAAEVEEKKQRRIALIYDALENDLINGLSDVPDMDWATVTAE